MGLSLEVGLGKISMGHMAVWCLAKCLMELMGGVDKEIDMQEISFSLRFNKQLNEGC